MKAMQAQRTCAHCLMILAAAGICGLLFNLTAPQGVGLSPEAVTNPLWDRIELPQAQSLHQSGALFVDARDVDHYQVARIRGAVSLSPAEWDILYPLLRSTLSDASAVVVYGRTLSRFPAAVTAQKLKREGLRNVHVVSEPIEALRDAGLPISEPRRRSR